MTDSAICNKKREFIPHFNLTGLPSIRLIQTLIFLKFSYKTHPISFEKKHILISWKVHSKHFSMPKTINKNWNRWMNQRQEKGSNLGTYNIEFWNIYIWYYYQNVFQNYLNYQFICNSGNFTYFSWYTFSEHTFNLFSVFWLF